MKDDLTPKQKEIYEGLMRRIAEKPEILDELIAALEDDIVDEEGNPIKEDHDKWCD